MKVIIVGAAALFAAVLIAASTARSQEAPIDNGIVTPLEEACATVVPIGVDGGLQIRSCRRNAPDELVGNTATVHLRIATDRGVVFLDVHLTKSLWHVGSWNQP